MFFLDDQIWRAMRRSRSPRIAVDHIISFDANAASFLPRLFTGRDEPLLQDFRRMLQQFGGRLNFDIVPYLSENADVIASGGDKCITDTVIAAHRLATLDATRFMNTGDMVSTITESELRERAETELNSFRRWLAKGGYHADLRWRHQAMHAQVLKAALLHIERPGRDCAAKNLRLFIEFQHAKLRSLMVDTIALAWEWFSGGPRAAICNRLQRGASQPVKSARNISWDLTHMMHLRQQVAFPTRSRFIIPHFLTFDQALADLLELCAIKSCLISPEFLYPLIYPQADPNRIFQLMGGDAEWLHEHFSPEAHAKRSAQRHENSQPQLGNLIHELETTLASYGR